jgi:hypothetical protein
MKKLMFAAAALTAGFAMADGIVSSDIVGYAQSDLKFGNTLATPQFLNISTDTATPLQSIIPVGDDTSDNVALQTLDAYGYTAANYLWVNWAGDSGDQEAWVDDEEFQIVEGVSFAPGAGLWVTGSSTDQSIQTAGAVGKSDVVVQLRFGNTAVGNPFPVSVDLQDIIPEGDDTSDNVALQTLDAYGYTVANYLWVNWAGDSGDQEAWVDDEEFQIVEGVSFAPGAGLWVTGSSDQQSIRFPAPEL